MTRFRLGFIMALCALASIEAMADDLPAAQARSARPHSTKTKIVKPAPSNGDGFGGAQFSNPYAPPVGAGKAAGADFPIPPLAAPTDPKGDVSLTYKWRANNNPVDKYNDAVRQSAPGGPGDAFMGGLKFGF